MPVPPDYFALYGIAPSLNPDKANIRKKYYELSRQHHPDRASAQDNEAQQGTLGMSAQVNEGYRVLNDEDALLGYLLRQQGVLEDEEQYKLPPEFLMEMMELNEAVGNIAMAPDMQPDAEREYQSQIFAWEAGFNPLKERFNGGERGVDLLTGLKDYYFRKKYLLRIKSRLL
jgi:molecular chaperone HscB